MSDKQVYDFNYILYCYDTDPIELYKVVDRTNDGNQLLFRTEEQVHAVELVDLFSGLDSHEIEKEWGLVTTYIVTLTLDDSVIYQLADDQQQIINARNSDWTELNPFKKRLDADTDT